MKHYLFIILLLFFGCSKSEEKLRRSMITVPNSYLEEEQTKEKVDVISRISKKIIVKDASINIRVDRFDESIDLVKKLVNDKKGFIYKTEFYSDYGKSINVHIKVPAENLDSFIEAVKKMAHQVVSESISSTDFTQDYLDVNARLANKRALENKYKEILKTITSTNDVLIAEEQLSKIRDEIESIERRIKYLEQSSAMSNVFLHINEYTIEKESSESIWSKIKDGISDGFEGVLYYSGIVLTILIASIIFSPVIFYSIRLIKSIIVRLKNKNIKSVT